MNLFLWAATPDLSYATTTLADLQLLIAALDDPSLPANAATIARVTDKIPALVQGDTGEPLVIASYDNATGTVSSWITDAGASVIACLGLADPVGDPLVTATDFSIVGSTRSGVLMLNTITLQQALQRLPARRSTSGAFLLQIRKTVSGITETVALIPLTVSAGVLSSTPIADAEAASSAAAAAEVAHNISGQRRQKQKIALHAIEELAEHFGRILRLRRRVARRRILGVCRNAHDHVAVGRVDPRAIAPGLLQADANFVFVRAERSKVDHAATP